MTSSDIDISLIDVLTDIWIIFNL